MNKSMTSKLWMVVTLGMLLVAAGPASANLVVSLGIESASGGATVVDATNVNVTGAGSAVIAVYATITGTAGTIGDALNNDGLNSLYLGVKSRLGGTLLTGGGVTSGANEVAGAGYLGWTNLQLVGTVQLNTSGGNDGVMDFGPTGPTGTTGWDKPRADGTAGGPGTPLGWTSSGAPYNAAYGVSVVGQSFGNPPTNSAWTFKVAEVNVSWNAGQINPIFGNNTKFDVYRPSGTTVAGTASAIWWENGVKKATNGTTTGLGTYTANTTGVTFTFVPEPATMAFLAMGGLGMIGAGLARRRARKHAA